MYANELKRLDSPKSESSPCKQSKAKEATVANEPVQPCILVEVLRYKWPNVLPATSQI